MNELLVFPNGYLMLPMVDVKCKKIPLNHLTKGYLLRTALFYFLRIGLISIFR